MTLCNGMLCLHYKKKISHEKDQHNQSQLIAMQIQLKATISFLIETEGFNAFSSKI